MMLGPQSGCTACGTHTSAWQAANRSLMVLQGSFPSGGGAEHSRKHLEVAQHLFSQASRSGTCHSTCHGTRASRSLQAPQTPVCGAPAGACAAAAPCSGLGRRPQNAPEVVGHGLPYSPCARTHSKTVGAFIQERSVHILDAASPCCTHLINLSSRSKSHSKGTTRCISCTTLQTQVRARYPRTRIP